MAEYLLKGGKMLEKTCRQCGCPQFEYKGKTFCVVCAEREQEKKGAQQPGGERQSPVKERAAAATGAGAAAPDEELATAIRDLCMRIKAEEDPDRCLTLMDSVKIGAEALQILRQL